MLLIITLNKMSVRFLDNDDFDVYGNIVDRHLSSGKAVILFYSDKCGACKEYKPAIEQLSKLRPDIKILMVSTLHNPELIDRTHKVFPYTVDFVPTVVSYDNGSFYSSFDYGGLPYYGGSPYNARREDPLLSSLVKYVDGIGQKKTT